MFVKRLRAFVTATLTLALAGISFEATGNAGNVEFVRGTGALQRLNRPPLLLARGMRVEQGDTITVGPESYAIVKLTDGTRMTVIANSTLVLQTYEFRPAEGDREAAGSMVIGLLKGGMRALTGVIPKQNPDAARVITATATVDIRGTDFDVRLCRLDCGVAAVTGPTGSPATPLAIQASARIIRMQGRLTATASGGLRRLMAQGGSVYPGDVIQSAAGAYAVLAFRDESVLTIQAESTVRIDDFVFDRANPGEGRFLVNLVRGGMRALTGGIGQANASNVKYRLPTATVGVRGTGTDMYVGVCRAEGTMAGPEGLGQSVSVCTFVPGGSPSAETDATIVNWEGSNTVTANEASCSQDCTTQVARGESVIVNARGVTRALAPPSYMNFDASTPRPDRVPYDRNNLWGVSANSIDPEAVYVFVRDGDIRLQAGGHVLDLGRNEAGFAAGPALQRLEGLPPQLILPTSGISPIDQFRRFMCS